MPRPRARSLFELGGQWIAVEPGTANLYRFWNDAGSGRTRRESLRTTDIESAKEALAEIVVRGRTKTRNDHLSVILELYFSKVTDKKPSAKPARAAGALLLQCYGSLARVAILESDDEQKRFVTWSIERGHALSYVSRNLSVAAAALAHAKINIDVHYNQAWMREHWNVTAKAPRAPFIPTDKQLATFFDADMPDNLRRWAIMAALTVGRPEAVIELSPASRRKDARLINLNPEGRAQNKKFRPIVREPAVLIGWLDKWEEDGLDAFGGFYCGYDSVEGLQSAIDRVGKRIGMPKLTAYSFRHKGTTVLRGMKVPEDQVSGQLGHHRPHLRSTAGYGEFDPAYLKKAAVALDRWWLQLQTLTTRSLFSQGIPKTAAARTKRAA